MSQQNNLVDVFFKNGNFWLRVQSWGYGVVGVVSYFTPYLAPWTCHSPGLIWVGLLESTYQTFVRVTYRKETKMWISSRMLASSSSAPVWRICMSFTTLGMQSKSQDPWLLDDFLQRHQYKNAATLMTRNGIQKRSAFGTSYWGIVLDGNRAGYTPIHSVYLYPGWMAQVSTPNFSRYQNGGTSVL